MSAMETTDEALTDALEQQAATADILRVISRSPADAQPVFDTIAAAALRLCRARSANVFTYDGALLHIAALAIVDPRGVEAMRSIFPRPASNDSAACRAVLTRRVAAIPDVLADPGFVTRDAAVAAGFRSSLGVPLMLDGQPIGAIAVGRADPGSFPPSQVNLLCTFAEQAVMAIGNMRLFREREERNRELAASLERQVATAEILRVLSQIPNDVQPVFDAIVATGLRLFPGAAIAISRHEGGVVRSVAIAEADPARAARWRKVFPFPLSREYIHGAAILDCRVVDIPDVQEDTGGQFEVGKRNLAPSGYRAMTVVPLVREGVAIGAIAVVRMRPGLLTETQIDLLKTFADQAVIAIENVRLFNETKEALAYQTATSEVLQVISGSMSDATPVFDKILDSCERLFGATDLGVFLVDGQGQLDVGAYRGSFADWVPGSYPRPLAGTMSEQAIRNGALMHWADVAQAQDIPGYIRDVVRERGNFAVAVAPLVWEGRGIGTIDVMRKPPRAYSDNELALLATFADQAVIAIQNARLFNERESRNRELMEALEQQTATSEILRVISRSPNEVQPVFDTIADAALNLCKATVVNVVTFDGRLLHVAAIVDHLHPQGAAAARGIFPRPPGPDTAAGMAVLTRSLFAIPDVLAEPAYAFRAGVQWGVRSVLGVPLLREGEPIGALAVCRAEPGPFPAKLIALLQTFADQAVIAIENVRLFKELQARTAQLSQSVDQLRALSEVGQTVSSTLDLETVLRTIVAHATHLTGMDGGAIYEYDADGETFRLHTTELLPPPLVEALAAAPMPKGEGAIGRLATTRETVAIADIQDPGAYQSRVRKILMGLGFRSLLAVPLLYEGRLLGGLVVNRKAVGDFEPRVVDLLKTFATQSALAIQNARLFREIEDKSRQLEVASRHKSAFLANMSHELRTPLNAIIGFTRVVMRRTREQIEAKQVDNLEKILVSAQHLLSLINAALDLAKVEAGRVDVNPGEVALAPLLADCVRTVEPLLDEQVALRTDLPGDLPALWVDEEKLRQIVINLLSNAAKFTPRGRIDVRACCNGRDVEIAVADTGIGIPADKLEAVFEEFEQVDASSTRAHGGTGLGLAIARRLARLMGGDLRAQTALGLGSTFTLNLPLQYERPVR